jgi:hypothetical protein
MLTDMHVSGEESGMTFPEWQHRFHAVKPLQPDDRFQRVSHIGVEAGLHYLSGNRRPYFSVTGSTGASEHLRECPGSSGGCIHDEVLKYWPELAPVVALHLSGDDGSPMYAEENGWYQLAGYYEGASEQYHAGNSQGQHGGQYRFPTPGECLQQFADHVRIPMTEARELAELWRCEDDWKASRRWFGEWLTKQADRFKAEANAAITLLDSLTPVNVG